MRAPVLGGSANERSSSPITEAQNHINKNHAVCDHCTEESRYHGYFAFRHGGDAFFPSSKHFTLSQSKSKRSPLSCTSDGLSLSSQTQKPFTILSCFFFIWILNPALIYLKADSLFVLCILVMGSWGPLG